MGKSTERKRKRRMFRILIPIESRGDGEALLPLAAALLRDRDGEIILVGVVEVPAEEPLSAGATEAQERRQILRELEVAYEHLPLRIKPRVRVAHVPWPEIKRIIAKEKIDLLLLAWRPAMSDRILGYPVDQLLQETPCDVALVRGQQLTGLDRILLPVRGGSPHERLALRIAEALAEAEGAQITVFHATGEDARSAADQEFVQFLPFLREVPRITRQVTVKERVPGSIVREAGGHQLIVVGASTRMTLPVPETRLGPIGAEVAASTDQTLILVRSRRAEAMAKEALQPPTTAASVHVPIPTLVDKWFAENTFDADEFADLERLLEKKQELGLTISLGLPALNEEQTVGKVIQTIRTALMEEVPLLDEMVLIDSGSTDRTVEIARELGVPVYEHSEILSQHGSYRGKGEALWKSLYVLEGDIIVWIDTDIKNIHPRFVYGLIGPLLRWDRIQYVKGFYRRPLRVGDKIQAGGGGRVTELVARPLLNLFWPKLSGLVQPLAGEYAGRRQALERLPFFTGYGVETGLLIDLFDTFGLGAIAQVDLKMRVHHNQPLPALSKMSFAIIQVVIQRLEDRHKIKLLEEFNKTMKLIRYEDDHYYLEVEEIGDYERPPMIEIPEYREKFGLVAEMVEAWSQG